MESLPTFLTQECEIKNQNNSIQGRYFVDHITPEFAWFIHDTDYLDTNSVQKLIKKLGLPTFARSTEDEEIFLEKISRSESHVRSTVQITQATSHSKLIQLVLQPLPTVTFIITNPLPLLSLHWHMENTWLPPPSDHQMRLLEAPFGHWPTHFHGMKNGQVGYMLLYFWQLSYPLQLGLIILKLKSSSTPMGA